MEHHADFAVPVARRMVAEARTGPDDGHGPLRGEVIALGWWVDPRAAADPEHVPAGTLYLLVDHRRQRPYWIKQADLTAVRLEEDAG